MIKGRELVAYIDYEPLKFAFLQKHSNASSFQVRHLQFIGQYKTELYYIPGKEFLVVVDAL